MEATAIKSEDRSVLTPLAPLQDQYPLQPFSNSQAMSRPIYTTAPGTGFEQIVETQLTHVEKSPFVTNTVIQKLLTHLATFESKSKLEEIVKDVMADATPVQEFYRIGGYSTVYAGQPSWSLPSDGFGTPKLKGDQPIGDLQQYLAFNRHLPFIALRTYDTSPSVEEAYLTFQSSIPVEDGYSSSDDLSCTPSQASPKLESMSRIFDTNAKATIINQEIIPVSLAMVEALIQFFQSFTYLRIEDVAIHNFSSWLKETGILKAPFVFWYQTRESQTFGTLSKTGRMLIEQIRSYIYLRHGQEFARVDALLNRGVITLPYINYLVIPDEPWIAETEDEHVYGCIVTHWASKYHISNTQSQDPRDKDRSLSWRISAWHYRYCGYFYKHYHEIKIDAANFDSQKEIRLHDLRPAPIRYADPDLLAMLGRRGELFWRFQSRQLVSYNEDIDSSPGTHADRYMIDFGTYLQLHPDSQIAKLAQSGITSQQAITSSLANNRHPPAIPELYLFPPQIIGYNLRTKKWVDLDVDRIVDVPWNKKAFDYLVLDLDTKELVLALVTNKLAADRGADLIENKGKGLTLLLHGSPGTGKTLTAESVAEIAEKPLFRATCADVGIQPEAVEKYLDSVFHFAKIWDCVVLLEEADVFLEKRTLDDLSRNALVTVFLRVLEYYEGILILTSNRVGTFDEAFKSRIQLSLHYETLRKPQRTKIWKNFMRQLKGLENVKIDFDDVESYVEELAEYKLNGRQIRNSITTARQLAQYKKVPMAHAHLKHVIEVANKFDTYIKEVQHGLTDEELAREDGLR